MIDSNRLATLTSASYALARLANVTPEQHKALSFLIVEMADAGESESFIITQVVRFLADICK